jgi:hypothetical protein
MESANEGTNIVGGNAVELDHNAHLRTEASQTCSQTRPMIAKG